VQIKGTFGKFRDYKRYYLFDGAREVGDVFRFPSKGVRFDDYAISRILESKIFGHTKLNENWPAEFDTAGMVRATRYPMGHAAKMWVKVGDQDVFGALIEEERKK